MQRTLVDYIKEAEYCSKCGRPLVDKHCPVHLAVEPVDENAQVVKEFKELAKINEGD